MSTSTPDWDNLNSQLDMDTAVTPEHINDAMALYEPDEPIPDLDTMLANGEEYALSLGLHRLKLGTYANALITKYGEETFKTYANSWGLKHSTLASYGKVVERYRDSAQFCYNLMQTYKLSYTLLRIGSKFPTVEERIAFALEARGNGWTCEGAEIEATKRLHPEREIWKRLGEFPACVADIQQDDGRVLLTLELRAGEYLTLKRGDFIKAILYTKQ